MTRLNFTTDTQRPIKDEALIQARSVLRTCLNDTPDDLQRPARRRVIERKIDLITRALEQ